MPIDKARLPNIAVHRRVTGSDVARIAGVSKSAVSRAYTGGVVSPEARARIVKAAAQLKYRPSHLGRSLATNCSRLIGLAVTHLDNQFYPEVVQTLSDRLAELDYRLVLFITHGDKDLDPMLDEILGYGVDGVIFASSSLSAPVALECREAGVPTVMFNSVDPEGRVRSVAADNRLGAETAAAFLLAGEHRRFGIISGVEESSTSVERCDAFADLIGKSGLPKPVVASGHYDFEGAVLATRQLLSRKNAPDALFCANDHMALAAIQTARSEFGRELGRDLSIVGFDDVPIAAWPAFELTTYAQPIAVMVERVIAYLLDELRHRPSTNEPGWTGGDLIVRKSARVPPGVVLDDRQRQVWRPGSGGGAPGPYPAAG